MYLPVILSLAAAFPNIAKCGVLTDLITENDPSDVYEKVWHFLDENGLEILTEASDGALLAAMKARNEEVAKLLINFAVAGNPELTFGTKFVNSAIVNNLESTLALLLMRKVNLHERDPDGLTCLHYAVRYERPRMLEMLLAKKSDVGYLLNKVEKRGQTALHYAAIKEKAGAGMADALLTAGAESCHEDEKFYYPFHLATLYRNAEYGGVLVRHNADPFVESKFFGTPLHFAETMGVRPMIAILKEYEKRIRGNARSVETLEIVEEKPRKGLFRSNSFPLRKGKIVAANLVSKAKIMFANFGNVNKYHHLEKTNDE